VRFGWNSRATQGTNMRGDGRRSKRRPREGFVRKFDRDRLFGDDNAAPFNIKSQIVLANN